MRKPIQLHNHDGEMYALCDDGSVWVFTGSMGWMAAGDIPQEDEPLPHDNAAPEPASLAPLAGIGKLWAVDNRRAARICFEEHAVEAVRAGLSLAEADTSSEALAMVAEGTKGGWSRQSYKGSYVAGKWTPLFYYLSEIPF